MKMSFATAAAIKTRLCVPDASRDPACRSTTFLSCAWIRIAPLPGALAAANVSITNAMPSPAPLRTNRACENAVPSLRVSPLPPFSSPLLSSPLRLVECVYTALLSLTCISTRRDGSSCSLRFVQVRFPPPISKPSPFPSSSSSPTHASNSPRSTAPKSPIILDDGASHDEDAATTGTGTPTSLQDESAAAAAASSDKAARRKRSLSADSLDKAAAVGVQVDALVAPVQAPREPWVDPPPLPPPASDTPWKSVATPSPPFVAVSSPQTAPLPHQHQHQHQHQHRSAYPISSAAGGFVQDAPAPVYPSPYSFVSYDLSPGFLPLPPSTTTTTSATLASVAPFPSSPSGLPEQYPETFPSFPVPTTLYYPIPGEPNHLLPSSGYPLSSASSQAVETYLPSPPLSLHDAALFQAGHGRLHLAPAPGPIGQQQPLPWPPTTTTTAPPPRSPPRLVANGFTYSISSSSSPSPRAHFDPGLQVRAAPTVHWSKGALPSFGGATTTTTTKRFETSPTTTKANGGVSNGGGGRRQVHEHGSPDWSVLRQQIQAGEHPRSRGTCKFFNPQTVSSFRGVDHEMP